MKAILFDLDDTLYDELTYVISGFGAVAETLARDHGLPPGKAIHTMLDLLMNNGRGRIFDDMLVGINLYSENYVQKLIEVYRTHEPVIALWPDVEPVLGQLRQHGLCLGIVTDGLLSMQREKVRALKIKRLVDNIIYTCELGSAFWKPHPAAFTLALSRLGVEPEEALYIGNDPMKDFAGPRLIGMLTAQVLRSGKGYDFSNETDFYISDLYGILELAKERRWI